jgi:putative membrane protein
LNKHRRAVTIRCHCATSGRFHVRSGHQQPAGLCRLFRDGCRPARRFVVLYVFITPYSELTLIREGNTAAAVSLGGAIVGYAMPIAVSVAVSHDIRAMVGWGVVACVVQLLAYMLARFALPQINHAIPQGKVASGIFLASFSLGIGILNAGCIA